MQLRLRLPPRAGIPAEVSIRVRGGAPVGVLRSRGADILGLAHLDAYLLVDGVGEGVGPDHAERVVRYPDIVVRVAGLQLPSESRLHVVLTGYPELFLT